MQGILSDSISIQDDIPIVGSSVFAPLAFRVIQSVLKWFNETVRKKDKLKARAGTIDVLKFIFGDYTVQQHIKQNQKDSGEILKLMMEFFREITLSYESSPKIGSEVLYISISALVYNFCDAYWTPTVHAARGPIRLYLRPAENVLAWAIEERYRLFSLLYGWKNEAAIVNPSHTYLRKELKRSDSGNVPIENEGAHELDIISRYAVSKLASLGPIFPDKMIKEHLDYALQTVCILFLFLS